MHAMKCQQLYLPETNILLTRFLSSGGIVNLCSSIDEFSPVLATSYENSPTMCLI
jgi:hypothetical protein